MSGEVVIVGKRPGEEDILRVLLDIWGREHGVTVTATRADGEERGA